MGTLIFYNDSGSHGICGAFQDTTTQIAPAINTPVVMQCNTTDFSNGVTVVANTQFTVSEAGTYNIQFSAQVDRIAGSGVDVITIWTRLNGADIPGTSGYVTISGSAGAAADIVSWNLVLPMVAGDYLEMMWSTPDLNVQLIAFPADLVIPTPASPSLIVTLFKV